MLELSEDGSAITRKWTDKVLDCQHGGVVVLDGYVYGASDKNTRGQWVCLDLSNGETAATVRGLSGPSRRSSIRRNVGTLPS